MILFDSLKNVKINIGNKNKPITIYLCGPTVYDYIHIGNARTIIVFDVLYRLLRHQNHQVIYVHNITDIDDKIITKAAKENVSEKELSDFYLNNYLVTLNELNIFLPTYMPRVSEHIKDNITFIADLIKNDFAYQHNENVYFAIEKFPSYGSLSKKNLDQLFVNYRNSNNETKRSTNDFVIWKAKTLGQTWSSPWGNGRPGWHNECAVFVNKYFNQETIDIHGGGVDLKFPHHENERALFNSHNQKELANVWWYLGHVNVDNQKMSKSLKNFILVKDFCQQYQPNVLRYLLLNHNHQEPMAFNNELIQEAIVVINKYQNLIKNWYYNCFLNNIKTDLVTQDDNFYQQALDYLNNNLDTTNCFLVINNIVKKLNLEIKNQDFSEQNQKVFNTFVLILTKILGFDLFVPLYSDLVINKLNEWEQSKRNKKYQQADAIRSELKQLGILAD